MPVSLVQRYNLVLALYVALAIGAAYGLPFLRVAPNRLLSGEPVYVWEVLQLQGSPWVVALMLAIAALLCFAVWQPRRHITQEGTSLKHWFFWQWPLTLQACGC